MADFDWKKHIIDCMESTLYCALSTLDNGNTWTCPLLFAYDDKFNLYFISKPKAKHMVNIEKNGNVSIAIYSTKFKVGEAVFGIQMVGKAKTLQDNKAEETYDIYYARQFPESGKHPDRTPKDHMSGGEWRFVKVEPVEIHYFNKSLFNSMRQRVPDHIFKK